LEPCYCDSNTTTIYCTGNETIALKTIFHRLSFEVDDGKKHFNRFYLNNTTIYELEENTFDEITFDSILLKNALNLSLIHTNAFTAINLHLKQFIVYNTSLKSCEPNYDIFRAISLMVQIDLAEISHSLIEEIPDYAFRPLNGHQKNLKYVALGHNKISKIGTNAFQYLSSLSQLLLHSNPLNHISESAFNILRPSENELKLLLDNCLLNSSSFEIEAFSHLNRPTVLYLNLNEITYLDQHVLSNSSSI